MNRGQHQHKHKHQHQHQHQSACSQFVFLWIIKYFSSSSSRSFCSGLVRDRRAIKRCSLSSTTFDSSRVRRATSFSRSDETADSCCRCSSKSRKRCWRSVSISPTCSRLGSKSHETKLLHYPATARVKETFHAAELTQQLPKQSTSSRQTSPISLLTALCKAVYPLRKKIVIKSYADAQI